jgi:FKBP12-rapamycin complex-associated protein
VRRQLLRVVGILGAPDPYSLLPSVGVLIESPLPAQASATAISGRSHHSSGASGAQLMVLSKAKSPAASSSLAAFEQVPPPPPILSEFELHRLKGTDDYFHIAAINALLRVANDPSQLGNHPLVVRAIMMTMRCLGPKLYSQLDNIVHSMLYMARLAHITNSITWENIVFELVRLVTMCHGKMAPLASDMIDLVEEQWAPNMALIYLLRALAQVSLDLLLGRKNIILTLNNTLQELGSEFRVYFPQIMPLVRQALVSDDSPERLVALRVIQVSGLIFLFFLVNFF